MILSCITPHTILVVYEATNEIQKIISLTENLLQEEQGFSCLLCNFAEESGSTVEAVGLAIRPAREIAVVLWHISIFPYTLHLLMSSPVFNSVVLISLLKSVTFQEYLKSRDANLSDQNPTYTIPVY